jgi:dipeptidyl aminopeptidase/acylaminoacyl peptidase
VRTPYHITIFLSHQNTTHSSIKEPRIRIGISICGCPDYLTLLERRAEYLGVPRAPPYFPASLRALVHANDTVPDPATAFSGKRVLVLAGADDKLVPWEASRSFVEGLDVGRGGRKVVVVVPGVKHEFTDGMRAEMFQFFWEEALVRGAAVNCAL